MQNALRLPIRWTKIYTVILLLFALWGNDLFAYKLITPAFSISPYRIWILFAPVVLLLSSKEFWFNIKNHKGRYYIFFLVILFAYALFSVIWAKDLSTWLKYSLFLACGCITTILTIGSLSTRKDILIVLRILFFIACFISLGGLIEVLTGFQFMLDPMEGEQYVRGGEFGFFKLPMPVFSMTNPNDLASFLFFSIAFTVILYLRDNRPSFRILYIIGIILFFMLILFSQSRSVFFGLFLSVVVGFLLLLKSKKTGRKSFYFILVGILFAVLLLVLFKLGGWGDEKIASMNSESNSIRMGIIKNAWHFFKPQWYRGLGWGQIDYYNTNFPIYMLEKSPPNLHNWLLELLFSCGFLVTLLYCYGYIRAFINLIRIKANNSEGIVLAMILSGFILVSIASSSFVSAQWFWAVWAIVAVLYGQQNITRTR